MYFRHSTESWNDFPGLVADVLLAAGITNSTSAEIQMARYNAVAASRLAGNSEGELSEIQAMAPRILEDGAQTDAISMRVGVALATDQFSSVVILLLEIGPVRF